VPTVEPGRWQAFIDAAACRVSSHLDLDRLLALARNAPPLPPPDLPDPFLQCQASIRSHRPVVAVAQDPAFHFTYPCNLDLLRTAGAEIAFFSPLQDADLPPGTAGVLLSGGFPELYAKELSVNEGMRRALRQAHVRGMPIYAECGGLMALTESIIDLDGREHPMFGLLPGRSVMGGKLTLGYRLARAAGDSWLLSSGEVVRGHEFHYSAWEGRPADVLPAYHLLSRDDRGAFGEEGACLGSLWASYVHVHFGGQPELPLRFVQACAAYAERIAR
jgi:cobyrinic acid a,c-diamide synthase